METQLHGIAVQFQVHVDKMKVKAVHNIVFKNLPFHKYNVCSIKFRSKHSSNTVMCLLWNLMEQLLYVAVVS